MVTNEIERLSGLGLFRKKMDEGCYCCCGRISCVTVVMIRPCVAAIEVQVMWPSAILN